MVDVTYLRYFTNDHFANKEYFFLLSSMLNQIKSSGVFFRYLNL